MTVINNSFADQNNDASFFFGLFSSSDNDITPRPVKLDVTTYIDFNTGKALEEYESQAEQQEPALLENDSAESAPDDSTIRMKPQAEPQSTHLISKREHKTKFNKGDPYYGKHLCGNGEYSCIKIKKGDSWKSLFPNDYERELVQRLNRTNGGLWNRSWLLVPNEFSRDYLKYSPLAAHDPSITQKTIIIDQKELAFGAYDASGKLVHWGPVNPGKAGTRTALGDNFKVYRKGGANCWSKKYEASIPYCIFFHGGYALHGFHMPGYPASHGCVRMNNSDAKWLNKEFADYKTKVIVKEIKKN